MASWAIALGVAAGMAMLALWFEREAWRERERRMALEAELRRVKWQLGGLIDDHRKLPAKATPRGRVEQASAALARFGRN